MKLEHVKCNLCGSDSNDTVLVGRDRLLRKDDEYTLVRCRDCGLVFLNPRPTLDSLGELYGEEYERWGSRRPKADPVPDCKPEPSVNPKQRRGLELFRGYSPEPAGLVQKMAGISSYMSMARSNFGFFDYVPGGRILDVGCGRGRFITGMKEMGWDAHGTDFSDAHSAYCRDVCGVNMCYGDFHDLEFEPEYFDVITMWQFLEHSYDPAGCIRKAHGHLKRGGRLLVAVPNFASAEARLFGEFWQHIDIPRHFYDFTPVTLARYFEQSGLTVEKRVFRNPPAWFRASMEYRREAAGKPRELPGYQRKLARLISNAISLTRYGCLMVFVGVKNGNP